MDRFPLTDPDWALAHFTLAADLTSLRGQCRFAQESDTLVVRYDELPFPALAFYADDAASLAALAARLVGPEESFYMLLNQEQAHLAAQAFAVHEQQPEWQMGFAGDASALDAGAAAELGPADVGAMQALAAEAGLMALEAHPLRNGPAFGVWQDGQLAAMAATHLVFCGLAEIGNVATRPAYRRQGLARQAVSALVRAHVAAGRQVFLMVFDSNRAAMRLYEGLGFVRLRLMALLRCSLKSSIRRTRTRANERGVGERTWI